ncbi:MAG: hypothetical protein AAGD96_17555 [Chloroflexota bacterium]
MNFLNIIPYDELGVRLNASRKTYYFRTKSQDVIRSENLFWLAAINTFPLDPPKFSPGFNLYALQDSMFGGLLGKSDRNVDIVWEHVDSISKQFLYEKVIMLHDLARQIQPTEERRKAAESGIKMRLFLVCSNLKSVRRLSQEFSFLERLDYEKKN